MKKTTILTVFLMGLLWTAHAAPGDTIRVSTPQHQLDYFGDFDSSLVFPDGTTNYRQILMTVTLGQYDCPGNPQYCHQWDYTVILQLMTATENYELGRFITPFATSGWSRFGPNWKQPYVFDVTDFYPLLQGTKDVRLHYSGYSGGFTAEIEFAFIEGTPERNVVGIENVYEVNKTYGDSADPYNNYLPAYTANVPSGTQEAAMKVIVTGHGADNNGCCEFDSHYYQVFLDGSQIAQTDIWRDDCGVNDLYPQGGTWIYDRSNWCPGLKVEPVYYPLSITGGGSHQLDVQFENYTGSGGLGSYHFNAILFYYGNYNKTLDASLTDIIAPTTNPDHFRANPSSNVPKISVRNSGSTVISSIDFSYGVVDSTFVNYTWTGTLGPLENKEIELPALQTLTNMPLAGLNGTYEFEVEITSVNGQTGDDDSTNNLFSSNFMLAPTWPSTFEVHMKTNNLGANGTFNQSPADVSWEITDMNGNVVASRTNANVSTQYDDMVTLSTAGYYKLKLKSIYCFGLYWWALDQQYPIYQPGFFSVTDASGTKLPLHNYVYSGTEHDDWGCEYIQYFTVSGTAGINETAFNSSIKIYPNPATEYINVDITGPTGLSCDVKLTDIQGRTVYQTNTQKQHFQIPVQHFSNGLYMLILENGENKKVEKILVE